MVKNIRIERQRTSHVYVQEKDMDRSRRYLARDPDGRPQRRGRRGGRKAGGEAAVPGRLIGRGGVVAVVVGGSLVKVEGVAECVVVEVAGVGAAAVPPDPRHQAATPAPDLRQVLRLGSEPDRGGPDQRRRLLFAGGGAAEAAGEADRGPEALLQRGRGGWRRGIRVESHRRRSNRASAERERERRGE